MLDAPHIPPSEVGEAVEAQSGKLVGSGADEWPSAVAGGEVMCAAAPRRDEIRRGGIAFDSVLAEHGGDYHA